MSDDATLGAPWLTLTVRGTVTLTRCVDAPAAPPAGGGGGGWGDEGAELAER